MNMNQKKVMVLLWIVIFFGLCGCQMETEEGQVNKRYLEIDEIEFVEPTIEYQEDSDFAIYKTKIKNNSSYIIKGVTIEVRLENGQHTTIVTEDTLKPNDISSWIKCVGPSSLEIDDLELTRFMIKTLDENLQEMIITYDVGRDFYTYKEQEVIEEQTPLIKVEDIEFIDPNLVKQEESVVFQTYLKNNSTYDLKSISYEFEDKDKETFTLFHPLEIKSESESSLLTVYSLKYSEWKDYEFKRISYTYQQKNELVRVIYDVRLKKYFINKE